MEESMKISLLFLCMIALTGISFAGDCTPALTITDVKYEGTQKISTLGGLQDLVLVKGQFNTLNTCLVPAKIRVDVTVTRKNGHVDTGFNEVPVATMGQTPQFSAIIN